MDLFDALSLIGGLCLFLFGMYVLGETLEHSAGQKLQTALARITDGRVVGFLTGLGVTAVIQSSSATTVMVVGFVNSGLLTLRQAIHVIMGANVGTTVTAWLLSLTGIESSNILLRLCKPTSFTPILALIGIILLFSGKEGRKKDVGISLLGFATLMSGMTAMSDSVKELADVPAFQNLFVQFENPLFGVLAGALLTAIIQSSSASVGILQALSVTGQVSFAAAIPIIMGQNIGTCVTALLASLGTGKNARRAAVVHLAFNVLGTTLCLVLFLLIKFFLQPVWLSSSVTPLDVALSHTIFNLFCTLVLFPMTGLLEKTALRLVPDSAKNS